MTVQEALDVAVTSIDFVVTDSRGRRVHGLQSADFEIYENAALQPITNFSEFGPTPSDSTDENRSPSRYIIYFDNTSLSRSHRMSAIEATKKFLLSLHPHDEIMIINKSDSPNVLMGMSSDRAVAATALDAVSKENIQASLQSDQRMAEREIRDIWEGNNSADRSNLAEERAREGARAAARNHIQSFNERMRRSAAALDAVVTSVSRRPGRKVLIVFSEWLPTRPGQEIEEFLSNLFRRRAGSGATGLSIQGTQEIVERLAEKAKAANVVVIPVNPESLAGGTRMEAATVSARSANLSKAGAQPEGFQILAQRTGGTAFFGSNIDQALSTVTADTASYYSAGWKAASNAPRFEQVEIRPKNPMHRIRLAGIVVARSVGQEMTERTIAYHRTPSSETNTLGVSIQASATTRAGEGTRIVPLAILVPLSRIGFTSEGNDMVGLLSFFVCPGDDDEKTFDVHQQTQPLRVPATAVAAGRDQSITFTIDGRIDDNDKAITVGVLDHQSGMMGFASVAVPAN